MTGLSGVAPVATAPSVTAVAGLVGPLQLDPSTVTTNADLALFFVIGLLAGAHCLGMCGPLVGIYADRMRGDGGATGSRAGADRRRADHLTPYQVRQHALFNSGRVLGYAAVGATFGLLGGTVFATVDAVTRVGASVRAATGLLVGGLVVLGGLSYLRRGTGASLLDGVPGLGGAFRRISGALTGGVGGLARSPAIVVLGTVHAVLPCPIIYPAYLYAFAVGDPVRGGLSLAVLGVGTFPTLFAYGTLLGSLSPAHRRRLHRVLGAAFVVLGTVLLTHGLHLLGVHVPHLELPYYQPLAP
ncbi:MAG: sulfite exporter TauE/SafE family protein [Halobacteriaceae archaeon]